MASPPPIPKPPVTISQHDIEDEIARLFGDPGETGLVIRVHGEDGNLSSRSEAFRELLSSLALYDYHGQAQEVTVKPPDPESMAKALAVLGKPHLKRRLFERILLTFGKHIVEPLGQILDTTPGGLLLERMASLRATVLSWIADLKLTHETQSILSGDLAKLLSDEYLQMLAEHEEKVQRPRVSELAQQLLHLIGSTFERAFRQWPKHARHIAESVARRMASHMTLRESPVVIRERIIEGIEEYLWIETSTEITGAVGQLFMQPQYRGITAEGPPELERDTYRKFAEACWDIVSENC